MVLYMISFIPPTRWHQSALYVLDFKIFYYIFNLNTVFIEIFFFIYICII